MQKSYSPTWPEVTIFWGAGATYSIGVPLTGKQGEYIFRLAKNDDIRERVRDIPIISECKDEVADLLIALGDSLESRLWDFTKEEINAAKRLFSKTGMSEREIQERVVVLRQNYDWDALKRIIDLTPQGSILDLFNILDMYISSGHGLITSPLLGNRGKLFIENYRLKPARNCLVMLISIMLSCAYYKTIEREPKKLEPYREFAEALGELMMEEGVELSKKKIPYNTREFYLFSYAIISMNFEPILYWVLLNAHRDLNKNPPYLGNLPLQLSHDMGEVVGVSDIEEDSVPKIWHSFGEGTVQRINDPRYGAQKIIRVGKYYFPHGNSTWRECPRCGKVQTYYGDKWGYLSYSLFPANLIPYLRRLKPKTREEEEAIKRGKYDVLQCPYCGTLTEMQHTPMIMQTSYKINLPPVLENIQRDLKVCLENTKHLVFMGYSLPPDDLIWKSIVATRRSLGNKEKVYCTVVVGKSSEKRWLKGRELENFIKENERTHQFNGINTIKQVVSIFGIENVRAFTGGIPEVWLGGNTKEKVKDLLYPEEIFKFPVSRSSQ